MINLILIYLWGAIVATLIQLGIFLVPGLALALIMNYAAGFVERRALNTMGRGWYLGLCGWLGTVIHELGHAVFCLIFRHKIKDIKFFNPDPDTGTLGYVEHSYNPSSIYQSTGNFFIGIGPIILGTGIMYLISYLLLGLNLYKIADTVQMTPSHIESWGIFWQLLQNLWVSSIKVLGDIFSWHNLSIWQFYTFIYLTFAIGSSMTLSLPDLKSTLRGAKIILVVIFIFNLATIWTKDFTSTMVTGSAGFFRILYATMFLTLLINTVIAGLILIPLSFLRIGRPKTG